MKSIIIVFALLLSVTCFAQINKKLSQQIDSLGIEDQSALNIKNGKEAQAVFNEKIRRNFPFVEKIFEQFGFPGYDLVGKNSSNTYWMLVQHSDFDVPFQKRVLRKMKEQVKKHNASGSYYAYLVDRTLLNTGKKQLYGTQILMTDSGYIPKPITDSLNVNRRRKEIGLIPLDDYLTKGNESWNEMNKGKGQVDIKPKRSILH